LYLFNNFCIEVELAAEQLGHQIARAIVARGPKTTRDNHQVRTAQGLPNRLYDVHGGIWNSGLTSDSSASIRQLPAEPLLMRIQHPPQHQFTAGVDDFYFHKR
jgi:hypothetical protein